MLSSDPITAEHIGTEKQLKYPESSQKESPAPAHSDMGFMGGEGLSKEREKEKKKWCSNEPGEQLCVAFRGFVIVCTSGFTWGCLLTF